jgi:hypothetical protein
MSVTDWQPNICVNDRLGPTRKMTVTTENQAVIIPFHKWQGVASSMIGVASVMITLLLFGLAVTGTEPPKSVATALWVLSGGMLGANLIGFALGIFGATDRWSRKLYPLLGLVLNLVILTTFVGLALVGLR